jgi:hypothetical protein
MDIFGMEMEIVVSVASTGAVVASILPLLRKYFRGSRELKHLVSAKLSAHSAKTSIERELARLELARRVIEAKIQAETRSLESELESRRIQLELLRKTMDILSDLKSKGVEIAIEADKLALDSDESTEDAHYSDKSGGAS